MVLLLKQCAEYNEILIIFKNGQKSTESQAHPSPSECCELRAVIHPPPPPPTPLTSTVNHRFKKGLSTRPLVILFTIDVSNIAQEKRRFFKGFRWRFL